MSTPDILAEIEAALVKAVAKAQALYAKEGASPDFLHDLARLANAASDLSEVDLMEALAPSPSLLEPDRDRK